MPKVKNPLFSIDARGTINDLLTFTSINGKSIVKGNRLLPNNTFSFDVKKYFSQTVSQQVVRSAFKETLGAWGDLTLEQKTVYKERAKSLNNTGVGLFVQENFDNHYTPVLDKIEYHDTLRTGFVEDLNDVYRINTKQLAHIVYLRRLK